MQNPVVYLFAIFLPYSMFGESVSILTVICAIKEPRVMRHMNTEAALLTAAAAAEACAARRPPEQRSDCHHSVPLFHVALADGGV